MYRSVDGPSDGVEYEGRARPRRRSAASVRQRRPGVTIRLSHRAASRVHRLTLQSKSLMSWAAGGTPASISTARKRRLNMVLRRKARSQVAEGEGVVRVVPCLARASPVVVHCHDPERKDSQEREHGLDAPADVQQRLCRRDPLVRGQCVEANLCD